MPPFAKSFFREKKVFQWGRVGRCRWFADIAQLGERQTEDLKVPGSIPGVGTSFSSSILQNHKFITTCKTLGLALVQGTCGAMDSAPDFGSGGCGFESRQVFFFASEVPLKVFDNPGFG